MTCITIETGTEGPRHDPYGWEEITVTRPTGLVVMLHAGLDLYVEVDGRRIDHLDQDLSVSWDSVAAEFEKLSGCTPSAARKAYERYRSRCRKCGGREFHDQAGFPGESFILCNNCGSVVDYDFNVSAVI